MEVVEGDARVPVVVLEALQIPPPPQTDDSVHDEFSKFIDDEEGGIRIGDIYVPPAPKPALSTDGDGPRLIITKIVNENFKSYAGTQVLGPFHKSFTAIVGPNGSGKSNVIDSMLFVFGYRAAKIRSKKISVLIHSSNKFPNITEASVAVHFVKIINDHEDENKYEKVPGSEIVISRTASKDNSSYYTLNGRRVQYKEVARVLKLHGIDLDHNRFLILQGEVEQIAMMKTKGQNEHETGMLEYLEDIIGSSRFKEPIEKLSVRVEELSEARKEKLNRVRLVETEKNKLEAPMKEAVDQLNVLNNFTRAKNTLLQKYIHSTNDKIQTTLEDKTKYQESLKELDDNLSEIQNKKQEKNKFLSEKNKKYESLEKRKEELNDCFRKMKSKDVALQTNNTELSKRKKNIEGVLEQEKGKLTSFEQVPDRSKRDIFDCEKLIERHKTQKKEQEEELKEFMKTMSSETKGLQDHKDKEQLKLIELTKVKDAAKKEFQLAESELKRYVSSEENEKQKLEDLKKSLDNATINTQERKTKSIEVSKILPKKESQLREAKNTYSKLKEEESNLNNKVRYLRSQVEESKNAFSANKHRGIILESLMNQKKIGALPGVFGRLGDLGAIDGKYDVAISTCCPSLDNIVVDTAETAQKCIEFLKAKDYGRATFIAADKQEYLRQYCNSNMSFPENVPRLFDLVRISNEKVKPVFYYALRDTLVAKDVDQASRICYQGKRHRVVTLSGEVFETVGTISGGGKTVIRGKIGTSVQVKDEVDPSIIQQQEEELRNSETKLNDIQAQLPEIENKISSLTRECAELKIQKDKLMIESKSLEEQIPTLKIQIKEQTEKVKTSAVDPKQKSAMEKKTKHLELLSEKANLDAEKVEKLVNEIHEKIVQVGSGKYKTLQNNIDELEKKIDKVQKEITRLNVAIKTSERNVIKSRDKIERMEKEIEDITEKLAEIKEEKKILSSDGANLKTSLENIEEQLSERDTEFGDLKEEITKLSSKESKLKGDRLEIVNSISKVDKAVDDLKTKIPSWKKQLSSLVLESVDIPGHEAPAPLAQHTSEELQNFKIDELQSIVNVQEDRLGDQKPNLQAILDYKAKEELYLQRANELEEITNSRNEMRNLHDQLRKKRHVEFMSGFNIITGKLKEMYRMITLGGDAELDLADSLDPFAEGVTFSVRPPGKSWKAISHLSGGEKTLSSLSLVFALHYYKPTPLYVMDEIDAALDFKNVSIVANYIKDRTKNAQFIIISLRYNMFELANRLVGIYKTFDCTKSLTIENTINLAGSEGDNDQTARAI